MKISWQQRQKHLYQVNYREVIMANNYHGKTILGELMDNVTCADADSTQAVYVGKETGGGLWVEIYVGDTDVVLGDTDALEFYLQTCSSSTLGDHEAPITHDNAGGQPNATGTFAHAESNEIAADAGTYGLKFTAGSGTLTFASGDLIGEIAIPETMMRLAGHTYVQLKMIETENTGVTGTIDAFVVARV